MKKTLLIISVALTLMVPHIHAMAGYTIPIDIPETVSMPLDEYISRRFGNVPARYCDEWYALKKDMKLKTFTVLNNYDYTKNNTLASARSVGFTSAIFARIRLDVRKMDRLHQSTNPADRSLAKSVLPHEAGHVLYNHRGEECAWYDLCIANLFSFPLVAQGMLLYAHKISKRVPAMYALSVLSIFYKHHSLECKFHANRLEIRRLEEEQADAMAYNTLAQQGECQALEDALLNFKKKATAEKKNMNPYGTK